METELNNTVNKTRIEFNDFIYTGLDTISLRTVRSEERRLYLVYLVLVQFVLEVRSCYLTCLLQLRLSYHNYNFMSDNKLGKLTSGNSRYKVFTAPLFMYSYSKDRALTGTGGHLGFILVYRGGGHRVLQWWGEGDEKKCFSPLLLNRPPPLE